jgi:hypothetical protein
VDSIAFATVASSNALTDERSMMRTRQGLDQFGEGRPPHTVAGRRRDDDRQLQSLCRFGQGDDVVLQFACRIVAHASHEANLMVDEDKCGVFGRKRLIRADLIGHYILLQLKGLAAATMEGTTPIAAAATCNAVAWRN